LHAAFVQSSTPAFHEKAGQRQPFAMVRVTGYRKSTAIFGFACKTMALRHRENGRTPRVEVSGKQSIACGVCAEFDP